MLQAALLARFAATIGAVIRAIGSATAVFLVAKDAASTTVFTAPLTIK
jgi:hypothetical protein